MRLLVNADQNSNVMNAYVQWLGLLKRSDPPNHYELLGIALFESDTQQIKQAYYRGVAKVSPYQHGTTAKLCERISKELGEARDCLMDVQSRLEYDATLKKNPKIQMLSAQAANSRSRNRTSSKSTGRAGRPKPLVALPTAREVPKGLSGHDKRMNTAKVPPATRSRFGFLTVMRTPAEIFREIEMKRGVTAYQAEKLVTQNADDLVVGPYVLEDEFGSGSWGTCFIATRIATGEVVSLRLLPNTFNRSDRSSLRSSIRAVKRIQSTQFQSPLDTGFDRGRSYIASKLVTGEDLYRLVKRNGPLNLKHALHCVTRIVEALDAAAKLGLFHLELRPSKLIVDRKGDVAVRDIAIAQTIRRRKRAADDLHTLFRTTPRHHFDFIAPELLLNNATENPNADIYSLGCILFFLVTGEAMYSGKDPLRTVLAHRELEIPSLASRSSSVPLIMDTCLAKMVAKSPDDRFQNYAQCHTALRTVAKGLPKLNLPVAEQWRFVDDEFSAGIEPRLPMNRISARRMAIHSSIGVVLLSAVVGAASVASKPIKTITTQENAIPEGERTIQTVESEDAFVIP